MSHSSITILGSTGSIGVYTLDVVARHPDDYAVFAITANRGIAKMHEQCLQFRPRYAVMRDKASAITLREQLAGTDCETTVLGGDEALIEVATADECDVVMAAIVGGAGLAPTIAAARAGKRVLLANKESLVMAGEIFMKAVIEGGAMLLPIDSEHNAIYQCMANGAADHADGIRRILLTGSGGPLLRSPLDHLPDVTPDEACAHPNWKMGRKISVDSATMMNKGLELIEACWLFDVPPEMIDIVIHPQSVIHSMVEYIDGSVIAQMGNPDMRTPIAHALAWPDRMASGVSSLDLVEVAKLEFEPTDTGRFPALRLAQAVAGRGQSLSIALNAANEIAVQAFLDELIRFTDIPLIIEKVLEQTQEGEALTISDVLHLDTEARAKSTELMKSLASAGSRN